MANSLNTTSTVTLVLNGQQSQTSLRDVTRAVNDLRTSLGNMRREDNPELYRQRVQELQRLRNAQREMTQEINSSTEEQKGFFAEFKKGFGEIGKISAGAAIGSLLAGGISSAKDAIIDFGKSVLTAFSTFEKFDAVLTNTLGSSGKSKKALDMLSKFAAETPFSMEELTGSFIKFANRGIIPTTDELKKMGDLAASQGKTFDELTEAVLDAMTGEFERLKEFGIRASKNGDQVKLSFKGVTQEVAFTEGAIKKAVLGFGAMDGVAGGMEKSAERIGGVISNISDNWDRFLTKIGKDNDGLIMDVAKGTNSLVEMLAATGSLAENLEKDRLSLMGATMELQQSNLGHDRRLTLIKQLKDQYPEYLSKIDAEKVTNGDLLPILNQINKALVLRVAYQQKSEGLQKAITNEADALLNVDKAAQGFSKTMSSIIDKFDKKGVKIVMPDGLTDLQQAKRLLQELEDHKADGTGLNVDMMAHDLNIATAQLIANRKVYKTAAADRENYLKEQQRFADKFGFDANGNDKKQAAYEAAQEAARLKAEKEAEAAAQKSREEEEWKKNAKKREQAAKALQKEKDDYAAGKKAIIEQLRQFDHNELADGIAKADKEVANLEKKYDDEIKITQKAYDKLRKSKVANPGDLDQKEADAVSKLRGDKIAALHELELKQEKDLGEAIAEFRDKMAGKQATELQKETDQINKFYDDRLKAAGTNQAMIDQIEAGRSGALTDAKLREEERFQQEKERLEAAGAVNSADKDAAELVRINKKYDDEIAALEKKFSKEFQATKAFQDLLDELEGKRKKEIESRGDKDLKDEKKKKLDFATNTALTIASAAFEISRNNRQREVEDDLDKLEKQRTAELNKKGQTESQKQAINEKYDKQAAAIKLKQWQADKDAALQMAAIQAALGMIKAIPNWYEVAAAGIAGAANIAIIASTKPPKMAKGGIIDGPSHSAGGVPLINGSTGQQIAEVEGDETLAVFSRETTRNNKMLINELLYNGQYRNGAPVKVNSSMAIKATPQYFATGGMMSMTGAGQKFTSSSTAPPMAGDLAETNALLATMTAKLDAFAAKPWEFPMRQFFDEQDKITRIQNRANPK